MCLPDGQQCVSHQLNACCLPTNMQSPIKSRSSRAYQITTTPACSLDILCNTLQRSILQKGEPLSITITAALHLQSVIMATRRCTACTHEAAILLDDCMVSSVSCHALVESPLCASSRISGLMTTKSCICKRVNF